MVFIEFDNKKGILNSVFEGDLALNDIVDYIREIKENTSYPRTLRILIDAREATANLTFEELSIVVEENKKSIENYQYSIEAVVITKPKETALLMLYKELAKNKKMKFQIFYTKEAAIDWLESYK